MGNILYGIHNCDTIKKARKWLEQHGVAYEFHDFRVDGLPARILADWAARAGWEELINRRSTTWRQLDEAERTDLDGDKAIALMLRHPTLIKRPVLAQGGSITIGFNPGLYQAKFQDMKPE